MRLVLSIVLLAATLVGCDGDAPSDGGAMTDGSVDGGSVDGGSADAGGEVDWVVNLVQPGGGAAIQSYLGGASEDAIYPITLAFYETYDDEFDFLYLFAPGDGSGRFSVAHRPAMPENGILGVSDDPRWGSDSRLMGVVSLALGPVGNGPTLHETVHYWGMFLDGSFGFGRDRTTSFGPHWGTASVNGQLGGFDGSTIRCVDGSVRPCAPEASGRIRYTIATFGPAANQGDSVVYAPIELYLMGLAPASDVTDPIEVLREADFIEAVPGEDRLLFEVDGIDMVTIADITGRHGERALRAADERAFRGAFVLVTDAPADAAMMEAARSWSRIFAGEESSSLVMSFEDGTGGRATMDTAIVVR